MKRSKVPPLGPKPKFVFDQMRIDELKNAFQRYISANWPIPIEHVQEYNELVSQLPMEDDGMAERLLRMKEML